MKKWMSFLLVTLGCCLLLFPVQAGAGSNEAYQYLNNTQDRYHKTFDVYTDLNSGGNHFAARCAVVRDASASADLAGVSLDDSWSTNCRSGSTCIRNTLTAVDSRYWGGWYFQNGVLSGCDTGQTCNWGVYPNAGFNLAGAKKLTFWARGEKGGEKIEFFVGGTGWSVETGQAVMPYPDSTARVPRSGTRTTLSKNWKQYTISLANKDLSYMVGGFAWVAEVAKNPSGAVFYLDDIQYVMDRTSLPRFSASYSTLPVAPADDFDTLLKNTAYVYDNAVTLLALLARGTKDDLRRARLIADAFVYAQGHDRFYENDGRLRNAYQAGDLITPPGWTPNGRENAARLPGWWDVTERKWYEDAGHVGTDTGNMAWAMLALLRAHKTLGDERYLASAKSLGNWIETNTMDTRGSGGYTGGIKGWEASCGNPGPEILTWKSTEHNIDTYVAFMTLYDLTHGKDEAATWKARALHAKQFVRSMWGACGGAHFATGTGTDGASPNCDFAPEDVNTWGLMALGEVGMYGSGVDWVKTSCTVTESCFGGKSATGIDFNSDRDGVWWEGTAHTVIAKRIKKDDKDADALLANLRLAQTRAPNTDRKGIVATCRDGLTTGSGFFLYNRLHIAATSWYALSELKHNPYWGIKTTTTIPHQDE